LAEGDRVLIFTQFAQMGHLLKPYLEERFNRDVLFLHGALPKRAREKVLERFRHPDGPPIFILSLKAGGFGLNLTEANQVVHYDQWWNPAVEEQATDRAYRIGQLRTVQVRKFICKGTLEEKIHSMLQHKRDLADQVVGSTKNVVTQLSVDELRALLQLTAA
ncbi:MAG: SWF/SNF helicase family protein, partial [Bdellovibrionales bacterium]|nr:SWF/SNF helicase family protein [Bdellovibrionales bacterium]